MRDVSIVDAVRTPFGRYNGGLAGVRPDGGGTGVATLCIGVGQGLALVLER
ncbi:hypothetical protein [Streptomyces griseosporeus]|jgi:acetyl-CoA acyltransferase|uniref:hypothetical protein n=1 Tax=Streptomyces griseosporeus TaxID=1910 RepID=UPI00368FC32F